MEAMLSVFLQNFKRIKATENYDASTFESLVDYMMQSFEKNFHENDAKREHKKSLNTAV